MLLTPLKIVLFNLIPKEAFVFYVNTRIQFVSKSLNVNFCVCQHNECLKFCANTLKVE